MNSLTRHGKDLRRPFALRFEAIARSQNLTTDSMLHLNDAPEFIEKQQVATGQLETTEYSVNDLRIDVEYATRREPAPSLIVPGLLGSTIRNLVAPFMCARTRLKCLGYDVDMAWVNGRTGCSQNAEGLRELILRTADTHGSSVNVIAYSKGCADALHMLGEYPDTHDAVRSLVSLAGVVHGTPLAHNPPWPLRKLLQYTPLPGVPAGDGRAIVDLSYEVRGKWLTDNPLPSNVYFATIAAAPTPDRVSRVLRRSYHKLAATNPANDSQVIDIDAILPSGDLLAIVNADHWAVALPVKERLPLIAKLLVNQNTFPRDVLIHALLEHLANVNHRSFGTGGIQE